MARRKKKRKVLPIVIVLILLVVIAGAAFLMGNSLETKKTAEVTIEEGSGSREIAAQLKKEGIIQSETGFLIKLKLSGYAGKLKYGTYEIQKGTSYEELLKQLSVEGKLNNTINVTIPEGYTAEMIGAKLEKAGLFKKEDFLKAVSTKEGYHFSWLNEIKETDGKKYILQGYLYPDTYNVYTNASPENIVEQMLKNFEDHYKQISTDQSMDEIITKASLIERETSVAKERPIIAGVIENRLKKNMRLQIDPTALYPLTDGMYNKTKVTYKDLKIDSPYNTYRYKGLPVGPICNPSLSCMEAAANPKKHKYLYYHTKSANSAEHDFYETYEEHLKSQK